MVRRAGVPDPPDLGSPVKESNDGKPGPGVHLWDAAKCRHRSTASGSRHDGATSNPEASDPLTPVVRGGPAACSTTFAQVAGSLTHPSKGVVHDTSARQHRIADAT